MSDITQLVVGTEKWLLRIPAERHIALEGLSQTAVTASPAELTREALEHPVGLVALRQALTPDDQVAIVLEPNLPAISEILQEVLAYLCSADIQPASITIITPPNSVQDWVDQLPEAFADVRTEIHDPTDASKLAYLATTAAGRRLYLNRTLVNADLVLLLTGRRFDPVTGYAGAETAIFPAMTNEATQKSFVGQYSTEVPGAEPWPVRAEAAEIMWLLGAPFLVQIIEGFGDTVAEVVAGLPESIGSGIRSLETRWRAKIRESPDTILATISGDPSRISFLDLAKAAATAARVVRKGGRIAILTRASPQLGDGAQLLRSMDSLKGARKRLALQQPHDWLACYLWAFATRHNSLFLASQYPDEVVEDLFATPIRDPEEVQRLIDNGGTILIVPDAHKTMVSLE
jgi:nickel-dependent lactate racemase